ncbi:MAG: 1-acyl-sn-glycerol-3-phosphate acyltransferase [Acidimicrobiia bacterium]|nr:1-acyl-sn-glycerol-3-phosphate acyltransferase [Actinomycetota bacterium]MBL6924501.1 1-acyl-sn-glycerol-3-phosphate acyltransferase [Acidimicrobiia bacterium]MBL6927128.1 1-acyl-sn-glycerol-3-phosphate acyltransferase [Acidimicrobiia bacterium]
MGPPSLTLRAARLRSLVGRLGFPWRSAPVPAGVEPPPPTRLLQADYDTAWARRYPARVVRASLVETVMRFVMSVVASPAREGTDRLNTVEGPVVFIANHHSHADTPLLLTSIPDPWRHRLVVGAAADYFFATRLGSAVAALLINAIPIERTKVGRRSANLVADLIDDGWSVLIFPEGGRSPDGWGQPFRGGAAYLAIRCGVPVVPIHIAGTDRILRKGRILPSRSSTTVTFGDPLTANAGEHARGFATRLEAAVASLGDEAATDWWRARRRAHAGTSPGLTGPEIGAWRRVWALGDRGRKSQRRKVLWPDL